MALWTDMSPTGYERQVATNILFTHVFSGFTLWELIVSLPYDWKVFRGRRGCKWGAWIFYLNSRYLFMCSVVATLVFVDLFASKLRVVTGLGLFFQISGHVAAGFSYGILALRMMIIWRRDAMTLLMIVCQLALWAMTFAAFPHIIDGWQEQWSHIRLTTTLLVVTSIMLLSDYLGLVTAYRYYLARLKNREGTVAEQKDKFTWFKEYCAMLWQEGLQYFVIVWLAQIAEATVRFLNVDQSGLLRFTVEYAGLTATYVLD
ncbi:hypothetical protein EUX98_g9097 [Antrodiella citrinella]|uniref:Uncharacterized protein n=1 Tax=Antrodiella citrinella TaxID=2447956 RepID=A0A4S4M425_9APHY|nr:hypothetical protein EUX98_g9097 [Antrodiella citrinella]